MSQCYTGSKCDNPGGELRPCHICPKCKDSFHQRCATFGHDLDELVCIGCTKISTRESSSETDLVDT